MGWVLIALQNAFFCLAHHAFEEALVDTVGRGGDTDTNAAIAGALRPRPMSCWPDDVLEVAEALLLAGQG